LRSSSPGKFKFHRTRTTDPHRSVPHRSVPRLSASAWCVCLLQHVKQRTIYKNKESVSGYCRFAPQKTQGGPIFLVVVFLLLIVVIIFFFILTLGS
jgi:hypothetical protein